MHSVPDLIRRLSGVRHFQHIQPAELEQIVLLGQVQSYRAGETIFQEEGACAGLFVLLSGQVQLGKLSPQGQNAILAVFDPVIMFNEVAALDRGSNPATATAIEDSFIWRLDADHLEILVIRYPHVGLGLLRVIAARNRRLVGQFEDLSFRSVLSRTAKLLLELSANGEKEIDRRRHPVHQMAARIATVPEAFSRSLKVFRTNGDIRCSALTIEVLHAQHLSEIAEIGTRVI